MPDLAKPARALLLASIVAAPGWAQDAPNRPGNQALGQAAGKKRPAPAAQVQMVFDGQIIILPLQGMMADPAGPAGKNPPRVAVQVVPAAGQVRWTSARLGNAIYRLSLEAAEAAEAPEPPEPPAPEPPDDFEEETEPPDSPMPRGANVREVVRAQVGVLERKNFDRIVFGGREGPAIGEHLAGALRARIARVARERPLDGPAREKLRLAGLGDIKHLLDRIDEARAEFEAARGNVQQAVQALQQAPALAKEFRGAPFEDDSLFAKTLRTLREARQSSR